MLDNALFLRVLRYNYIKGCSIRRNSGLRLGKNNRKVGPIEEIKSELKNI